MNETQLEGALKSGGAHAVIESAQAVAGRDKVALLKLAIRKIAFGAWPDHYLDEMIKLGDAAVAYALSINEVEEANIICFNMAANLCDCWNDAFKRETRHFERGLSYANRALEFRRQLEKSPEKVAMAHWARGKHLLSLGRFADAVTAFVENVECLTAANIANEPEALEAAKAYLGLAQHAAQISTGKALFEQAVDALMLVRERDETKSDGIQIYLDQLEATKILLEKVLAMQKC